MLKLIFLNLLLQRKKNKFQSQFFLSLPDGKHKQLK